MSFEASITSTTSKALLMKKLFVMLGAALGLATAQTTTPVSAPVAEQRSTSADTATTYGQKSHGTPAVAKSNARAVDQKVEPRFAMAAPRYFPRQGLRRVKYGKSRWIVLS